MNASKVNAFVAAISPPLGTGPLSRYLSAAGKALGGKSDATLAKQFAINPTTMASWKRRGKLTEEARALFVSTLPTKIIHRGLGLPMVSRRAREALVILIVDTHGDPLRLGQDRAVEGTSVFLGGLLAMAEFLAYIADDEGRTSKEIAELMAQGFIHTGSDARFSVSANFPL